MSIHMSTVKVADNLECESSQLKDKSHLSLYLALSGYFPCGTT